MLDHQAKVAAVKALLAGKDCGRCGHATCAENAEAIVSGASPYNSCLDATPQAAAQIRQIVGRREPAISVSLQTIWQILTSVGLAIALIIAITLLSIVGTLIPQEASAAEYIQRYGQQGYLWLHALKLDGLFQAWYFLTLLLALLLNTAACALKRSLVSWRLLSKPMPDRSGDELPQLHYHQELPLGDQQEQGALTRTAQALRASHFRVRTSEDWLKASKNRYGRLGVDLLHLGLIVILIGAIYGSLTGFSAFQVAHAGETFQVPQSTFSVRVDKLWSENYANSEEIKGWYTTLTVIDGNQEVLTRTIEVNHPLTYKGISFYQASFGSDWWDQGHFTVQVVQSGGKVLGTYPVDSHGSFSVSQAGLTVTAQTFFSDFALDENFQAFDRSQYLNNPALLLTVRQSDGTERQSWSFAQESLQQFYEEHLSGQELYHIRLLGMTAPEYTGLRIAANPGLPVIYGGFILMMLGLFLNFYLPPRWVWVAVAKGKLQLGALGRDHREFEPGFAALIQRLQAQLQRNENIKEEVYVAR